MNMNKILADNVHVMERTILEKLRSTAIWDALIPKTKIPPLKSKPADGSTHPVATCAMVGVIPIRPAEPLDSDGREYNFEYSRIRSPYVCLSDLTTGEATSHILTTTEYMTRRCIGWAQHRRLETCFEKASGGLITCDGTQTIKPFTYGDDVTSIDPSTITHGLREEDIQIAWDRISRLTEREQDYGRRDGEPQHALVMGQDAFPSVEKKPPFMDSKLFPLRYSHSIRRVGPMIHIVNPLPPRYTDVEGKLVRVEPLTADGNYNSSYDTAEFEVAYALHKSAMEYQVQSDDPENYLADIQWLNGYHEEVNPVGDVGYFMATMAGAMCPRKTEAAITLIFRRA